MNRYCLLVVFGIAIFPLKGITADTALLPEIVVTAERSIADRLVQPSSVRVFTPSDFEHSTLSVGNWIEREAGLQLSQTGDDASASTMSIRGSSTDQVDVYLNGVRLNPAAGGGVNLSQLSLHHIKKITLYKGQVPLSVGGAPIGGAIFIETDQPDQDTSANALLRYGSFNTIEGFTAFNKAGKRWSFDTSYDGLHTDGDFSFLDDNGTPANSADDVVTTRRNNESTRHDWQGHATVSLSPENTLHFFQRMYREDRGVPGIGSAQSQTADLSSTQSLSAVSLSNHGIFGSATGYTQRHSFLFQKNQFSDPNAEIGLGDPQDNDDVTLHYTTEHLLDWTFSSRGMAHFRFSYEWEDFAPEDFLDTPSKGPEDWRHRFQWGSEVSHSLVADRLLLTGNAALIHSRNAFNDNDPSSSTTTDFLNTQTETLPVGSLQADFALIPDWLFIDAEASRAIRLPDFFELFGDRGGIIGNPFLNAEKSWTGASGIRASHRFTTGAVREFFVKSTYFERRTSDLIQFSQSNNTARAENVGESRARGWEWDSQVNFFDRLDVEANYTLQQVKNLDTDKEVPGHPRHHVFGELSFHQPLGRGESELYANWRYEDGRYLDFNNSRRVAHSSNIGAGGSYRFSKGYRLFVEARNLTNNQLVDIVGYPLPGQSITGGVEWNWSSRKKGAPQ